MNSTKQRKIFVPLLAAGMILLLVCGILGGYAMGLAKGRASSDAPAAEPSEPPGEDLLLYVEGPRVYEGDYYDFPDQCPPNEERWVESCQIPTDVMETLTTRQLFESCLRCPLHIRRMLSSTMHPVGHWMGMLEGDFNGMRELRRRADFSAMLVSYFQKLTEDVSASDAWTATQVTAYLVDQEKVSLPACLAIREQLEGLAKRDGQMPQEFVTLYDTLNCYICGNGRSALLWSTGTPVVVVDNPYTLPGTSLLNSDH